MNNILTNKFYYYINKFSLTKNMHWTVNALQLFIQKLYIVEKVNVLLKNLIHSLQVINLTNKYVNYQVCTLWRHQLLKYTKPHGELISGWDQSFNLCHKNDTYFSESLTCGKTLSGGECQWHNAPNKIKYQSIGSFDL